MTKTHHASAARSLLYLSTSVILAGCAHQPPKLETLVEKNVAGIKAEHSVVAIERIDGKTEKNFLYDTKWLRDAELSPGEHTLTLIYVAAAPLNNRIYSRFTFKLVVEPGHLYLIKDDGDLNSFGSVLQDVLKSRPQAAARIWIVDAASDQEVGEVLESEGEPVRNNAPVRINPFFSWSLAQKDNHMRFARRKDSLTAAWEGKSRGESYFVTIQVHELPELKSADDFTQYVKQARQRARDDSKINWLRGIDETVETLVDRADYCVKYHHSSVISNPGPIAASDARVYIAHALFAPLFKHALLESHGYGCRVPKKKDYWIEFEYSHLSDSEKKDPAMAEQAEQYFGALEF